jgi:hypothetical protein
VLDDGAEENADLEGHQDHLLFWPIGQQMFADIARECLDHRVGAGSVSVEAASDAFAGLSSLEWRLSRPPWRNFLLVYEQAADGRGKWKMRSEERAKCVRIGQRIQLWLLGIDELDHADLRELETDWSVRLIPYDKAEAQLAWTSVKQNRVRS